MKTFNAFQAVVAFALCPFGIQWLTTQEFPGNVAAFWVALVVYFIGFVALVAAVRRSFEDLKS
jgi:ABC-type nitrate/sulfonate/bicarbonate transport system permease component